MANQSAGLLVYRFKDNNIEVLLVHPGGPVWKNKDENAWSIPKGEFEEEEPIKAAYREFEEEIGQPAPGGEPIDLGSLNQASRKEVFAWALEGSIDTTKINSNTFEMEWPPRSGQRQKFPEVDRAEWFDLSTAARKVHKGQEGFLRLLAERLGVEPPREVLTQINLF